MLNRKTRVGKSAAVAKFATSVAKVVETLEDRKLFAATPAVTGFTLYDAGTDKPIADITSGTTLNLAKLPANITVVAKTANAESVRFGYDGNAVYKQDSTELYALAGKSGATNLYQMNFVVGSHTVTAIAYSKDVMQGTASPTMSLNLNVVRNAGDNRAMWGGSNSTSPPPTSTPTSPTSPPPPPSTPVSPPPPPPPSTPTTPSAPTGTASLVSQDTTIIAGQAFFASAEKTALAAGQATTANYAWDFGDAGSSYNQLTGFNAAHRYQKPGTYTVTLTVTDEAGNVKQSKQTVVVQADTRKTIYVSPGGNDKNDGLSTTKPIATLEQAERLMGTGGNVRILLQRGASWNVTDWFFIKGQNVEVGAYGTGAKPVLKKGSTSVTMMMGIDRTATDVVIHDIAFDTNTPGNYEKAGAATGIFPQGTRTAVYDCDFVNVIDAVNANTSPVGLLVQDNVAPTDHSIRGYFVWLQGSDAVILGNKALNSTREHIIRVGGADRVLIANNTFGNKDLTSSDRSDIAKAVFNNQVGEYIYITDNQVFDGPTGVGPLGGADGVSHPEDRISNVVIDGNTFTNANLAITGGSDHVFLRNNVISRNTGEGILINPKDTYTVNGKQVYAARTILDLTIANNTFSSTGTVGNFLLVKTMGTPGQITLANNVSVTPNYIPGGNATAAVYIAADAGTARAQFREISGNVWSTMKPHSYAEGGYFYVWPSWSDKRGYLTLAEWSAWGASTDRVANLSINATTGVVTGLPTGVTNVIKGVFDDRNDKLRSFSKTLVSAGAIQL